VKQPPSTTYRALDMLYASRGPKIRGKEPFWRPTPPAPIGDVANPRWNWRTPLTSEDGKYLCSFDANGAYLSAISTVEVAHGQLYHTPNVREFVPGVPGLWQIDAHPWPAWDLLMSPLGGSGPSARDFRRVWVATPTMVLLTQLMGEGRWPDLRVYDSWTGVARMRLREWAHHIRGDRDRAILDDNAELLAAIKLGYSQALVVMSTQGAAHIHRPDWAATIRAQSAATIWRRAWQCVEQGYRIVGAGNIDELVFPLPVARRIIDGGSPLTIDPSGVTLGTFKVKRRLAPSAGWPRA
jgi:hypothetical protein